MPRSTVADFSIDRVEILDQDGRVDESLEPDLPDERLREWYRTMKLSRRLDERTIALQRRGELGTFAPATGQEAAQVGSTAALADDDWTVPAFREHPSALARGLSPQGIFEYAMGLEEGGGPPDDVPIMPPAIAVGSQPLHAAGIGWAQAMNDSDRVALTYFGDGATSEGEVYEAMNLAGVYEAQTIFCCQNNQYAISTPLEKQTRAATLAQKAVAAGIEPIQVDGNDVLGVYAVTKEARERALRGVPTLIEATTYRREMHTTADDPSVYRTTEEEEEWEPLDPILRFEQYLRDRGVLDDDAVSTIEDEIETELEEALEAARETKANTDPVDMFDTAYAELPDYLERQREAFTGGADGEIAPPRAAEGARGDGGTATDSGVTEGVERLNMVEAIRETLNAELDRDEDVVVYGQDVGVDGGVFRATQGLLDAFPDRVHDAPVAEAGIVGLGVGLAAAGHRPVAEIQFAGFTFQAFDQIHQHVSRLRSRSRGKLTCPMVIRAPYGLGVKALEHHSESYEAGYAHIPGLKTVIPSTARDAAGLLRSAIRSPDPVLFFEPMPLYRAARRPVPADHVTPLGEARVVEEGTDVTVVAWGAMVREVEGALEESEASADVIDLRTISPMDTETVRESVRKTGRCVVVHEAPRSGGFGAEVAARISDEAVWHLEAPIERVAGYDVPVPLPGREEAYRPDQERIRGAIERVTSP
ncbi:pyruvate dehydrogenase (acetyl-transferring) E1 component subunit alpha [Haloterrigena salina JCM 13891]|uniref:3-methyl-2-oxobutanoate dehydrogenase (2-methylpropanoyl-transferring) n=1 Tax=Haloterrigena salina JCM 13891 TaxID=1227488 RepID=M0C5Z7_9EURY|nr:pyruvate dehydrogenase (acetyl-transferring) E1 component subunit alpha [Haloterrigena salina]ELZ18625.1 pyruvate dehydrogenase (acetyl-transferring) E1 component subunit alpha [Haloterrigena salina JCM 13891]